MQRLSAFAVTAVLVAACSLDSAKDPPSSAAKAKAVSEVKVPAVLAGAGRCAAGTCTMHFAAEATGDTSSFSSSRCGDGSCPTKKARLTSAAQHKARAIGARLAQAELEDGYGCPGCVDGPTYVAVVHHGDGSKSSHTFDPIDPDDSLPQPLREASSLIEAVSEALGRCESTELVQVEPDCAQNEDNTPTGRP